MLLQLLQAQQALFTAARFCLDMDISGMAGARHNLPEVSGISLKAREYGKQGKTEK